MQSDQNFSELFVHFWSLYHFIIRTNIFCEINKVRDPSKSNVRSDWLFPRLAIQLKRSINCIFTMSFNRSIYENVYEFKFSESYCFNDIKKAPFSQRSDEKLNFCRPYWATRWGDEWFFMHTMYFLHSPSALTVTIKKLIHQ